MPYNYESTVVRDNYEISVWNDIYDEQNKRFTEEKVAVIGSNTMTAQTRALDPTLTENTNGTKTLTFSIYYRYIDHLDGIEKINPFIKLLLVERKIKLHWKDEWYDFIIKTRVESSDKHSFYYTCENLAANELTKTGYNLEFDTELSNNTDTIWNLAQTVLDGTDWRLPDNSGGVFRETVTEAGYKLQVKKGNSASTINGQSYILVFYNTVFTATNGDSSGNIMFQAWVGDLSDIDDQGIIRSGICITDTNASYTKPSTNSIKFTFKYTEASTETTYNCTYNTDTTVYEYRAKRDILQQLTVWSPPLKRYVGRYAYTNDPNSEVLGYTTAEYVAPDTVTNLIVNSSAFSSTDGWLNADQITIYPIYGSKSDNPPFDFTTYDPHYYLLTQRRNLFNKCFIGGSQYLPDGLPAGTKLVVKAKVAKAVYNPSTNKFTIGASGLPENIYARIYKYNPVPNESNVYVPDGNAYGSVRLTGTNGELSGTLTISTTITRAAMLSEYLAFCLDFSNSISPSQYPNDFYAIESVEFYLRKLDSQGHVIKPNTLDESSIITYTSKYFDPAQNNFTTQEEDISWLQISTSNVSESDSYWDAVVPKYDETCQKIRTITGKNSTRYNWLQTLAETFEVWCKFWVEHEADGRIAYEIKNGVEVPKKFVTFVERIGEMANYGFIYGIDLRSIQRNIDSSALATKIIVPQNSNEFATDGFCTIQRSPENYSKENYIINLDYYCDNGLIDRGRFYIDLYGSKNAEAGDLGYYQELHRVNTEYYQLSDELAAANEDLVVQKAYLTSYTELLDSTNTQLNAVNSDITRAVQTDSNGQATGYTVNNIEEFMDKNPAWDYLITLCATKAQLERNIESYSEIIGDNNSGLIKSVADLQVKIEVLQAAIDLSQEEHKQIVDEFNKRYSRYIQEGTWTSEDYTDDTKYYLDAKAVAYTSARPKLTYNIQVARLSALDEFKNKVFHLGDISWVEDEEFFIAKYREEVVVTQVVSHLDSPENDTITVQNYRTEFQDLFQRTESTIHSFQYGEGSYERAASIINTDGTINLMTLENSIANNNFLMSQSGLNNSVTTGKDGITVTDLSDISKRVRITANGVFISKDGGANWINAIKGDGISTNVLAAGSISTKDIVIDGGQGNTFRWDDKGISAYYFDTQNSVINTSHFLRFDRFGVYGVTDTYNFSPKTEQEVFDTAAFGMTWNRFFMKNKYGDHYVEVSSEHDIRVVKTVGSTETEQIKIGKIADAIYDPNAEEGDPPLMPATYGIRISDSSGNPVMETDSTGELWLKNTLHVGTTNNNYIANIGYLEPAGGAAIEWTWGTYTVNLDERPISPSEPDGPYYRRTLEVNNNFVVWEDGTVYAHQGYFEGTIHATDGYFSGTVIATEGRFGELSIEDIEALPGQIDELNGHVNQLKGIDIETQEGFDFITTDEGTTPSVIHLNAVAKGFTATPSEYQWARSSDPTVASGWTTLSSGDGAVGSSYTATYSTLPYFPYYIRVKYDDSYVTYTTLNNIQSGESPLMLEIISSTGTLFINNNISTTLTATVWKGTENVTSQYNGDFHWYKDGQVFAPSNHTNSVTVSNGDVDQKAVFTCTIGTAT